MGVLSHRLNNTLARNSNYEMVLHIVNDCLQGSVMGLGVIFAGINEFMDDRRRGIASYEALRRRLADNAFAVGGLKDYSGPVIRLQNLTPEDLYVLLFNIRHVYAAGDASCYLVPDEALNAYIQHCARTLGSEFYQTPGDAVKGFIGLLSVLEQNPGTNWQKLLNGINLKPSENPENHLTTDDGQLAPDDERDELATFRL